MTALDGAPVVVVGAGPVGLLLATRLLALGVPTRIVERRGEPGGGSRSIGVHPPGLAALASVGLDGVFRETGVRIVEGRAYGARGPLGALAFGPETPVLAVPQALGEAALEAALQARGGAVERGVRLTGLAPLEGGSALEARLEHGDGAASAVRASLVIGCDGRDSLVRSLAGIACDGGPYPDRYLMADLPDVTGLGPRAEIRLHLAGLMESFPLPGGWRRVVVRLADACIDPPLDRSEAALAARVCELALERSGACFDASRARMASAFGVERWLARRFVAGRVALAGDAAHVISPIGGQGLNLGWLDAVALADAIERTADGDAVRLVQELARYDRRRRRAARIALRRAEWNTRLGRPLPHERARWRDALLRQALRPPWSRVLLGAFTMRGLA